MSNQGWAYAGLWGLVPLPVITERNLEQFPGVLTLTPFGEMLRALSELLNFPHTAEPEGCFPALPRSFEFLRNSVKV